VDKIERKKLVESRIDALIDEFDSFPDKFLTEEDLRSYLYHLLLDGFSKLEKTEDNSQSISLHCEIRWYGQSQDLTYRSDIVIFDVSQLKTKKSNIKLPSKGYGFNNPFVIIEIKLRRKNGKSDFQYKTKLEEDRKKLYEIKSKVVELGTNIHTYLLGFDKKTNINFDIKSDEFHKEYYTYSEVN